VRMCVCALTIVVSVCILQGLLAHFQNVNIAFNFKMQVKTKLTLLKLTSSPRQRLLRACPQTSTRVVGCRSARSRFLFSVNNSSQRSSNSLFAHPLPPQQDQQQQDQQQQQQHLVFASSGPALHDQLHALFEQSTSSTLQVLLRACELLQHFFTSIAHGIQGKAAGAFCGPPPAAFCVTSSQPAPVEIHPVQRGGHKKGDRQRRQQETQDQTEVQQQQQQEPQVTANSAISTPSWEGGRSLILAAQQRTAIALQGMQQTAAYTAVSSNGGDWSCSLMSFRFVN